MARTLDYNLGAHSWHDYTTRVATRGKVPKVQGAGSASQDPARDDTGGISFNDAVKMAQTGWQDGAKQIAKTLDALPPDSEVLPDWMLNVAGSICNVPAFIAGEPECMWHLSECRREERRITLVVQGSYGGAFDSEVPMAYATAIAAVVRSLEASGVNPGVMLVSQRIGNWGRGPLSAYGVHVREYGEPLDLAKVAFAFHPAFLRRIDFAWREMTVEATRAGINHDDYGMAEPYDAERAREIIGQDLGTIAVLRGLNELKRAELIKTRGTTVSEFIELIREDVAKAINQVA